MTLVLVLGLFGLGQVSPINPDRPLSVCQVLHDLPQYRGKVVEIRGNWNGEVLSADECEPLKTGDYNWQLSIFISLPERVLHFPKPAWQLDRRAYERAIKILKSAKGVPRATFVGRIDAFAELTVFTKDLPGPVPGGFGHLGVSPAQLVIATVKDVILQ